MPYQEWWRERPDETRQPAKAWCQIRRRTIDEDSIETHIGSAHVCFFIFGDAVSSPDMFVLCLRCVLYYERIRIINGKKTVYF